MKIDPIDWCSERLLVPGNPLAASLLFVEGNKKHQILALRAVISEIASNTELSHEPGLAKAKLLWWREALLEQRAHPALEALSVSGAYNQDLVMDLIDLANSVEKTLELARYETFDQAWMACKSLGGAAFAIEQKMLHSQSSKDQNLSPDALHAAMALGTFGYWVRLVRDLAWDARHGRWFVPLEFQADYQVSRQSVLDGVSGPRWAGLITTLLSSGLERIEGMEGQFRATSSSETGHIVIAHRLDWRLAKKLMKSPKAVLTKRVLPSHAGNVLVAWKAATKWQRQT